MGAQVKLRALWCLVQGGKQDSFQQWEVVPIEVFDVRQVKNSFKKLMKACVPSSSSNPNDQNMTFHRCLEESEWMNLVPYTFSHFNCFNLCFKIAVIAAIFDVIDVYCVCVL